MPFIEDMWSKKTASTADEIRRDHENLSQALEQAERTAEEMRGRFRGQYDAMQNVSDLAGRVQEINDANNAAQAHHLQQVSDALKRTQSGDVVYDPIVYPHARVVPPLKPKSASVKTAAGTSEAVQHLLRTIGTAVLSHSGLTDHITDTHWGHTQKAFDVLNKYHNAYAMGNTAENIINYFRNEPKNRMDEETANRHSKLAEQHKRLAQDIDDILESRAMGTPDRRLEAETAYDGTVAALRSAGMLGIKVPTPFTNYFNQKKDRMINNVDPSASRRQQTCEHGVPLTAVMNDAACPQCFNEANAHDDNIPYEVTDNDLM